MRCSRCLLSLSALPERVYDRTRLGIAVISLTHLQETYHDVNTSVWIQYSDGVIDKSEARVLRFARLLDNVGISDGPLIANLSERYLDIYSTWTYIPGALDSFLAIAGRCSVGILTNGFAEVQRQKLERFRELDDRSSCIVISEEVGYMKPDVRIFEHAAKESGTSANEILFIGDSYRNDVSGARNAGWRVAWYRPGSEVSSAAPRGNTGIHTDMTFSDWSDFGI